MKKHFWSLTGQLAGALLGLLTFVFLARNLSSDIFGAFLIYLSSTTFLEMIRLGVLHTAVVRGLQKDPTSHPTLLGSAWVLSLTITGILILLVWIASVFMPSQGDFVLFFKWYWLSAFALLPYDFGLWIHQANHRFKHLTLLRVINFGSFALFAGLAFWHSYALEDLVLGHIATSGLASLWSVVSGHSGLRYLLHSTTSEIKAIWNFGRYSMGTFMGTALLKTADTVLIGSFLGSTYVAYYGLATKILEALEIPLRALVGTALPSMSFAFSKSDMDTIRTLFYQYSGILTLLYLPLLTLLFILGPYLLQWIGGNNYSVESLVVFRILTIYGLLLPLDRFLGVTLDALGLPKWNMVKVAGMTILNVLGDLLVLYFEGGTSGVAWITVINVSAGVVAGLVYLNKSIGLSWSTLGITLQSGIDRLFHLLKNHLNPVVQDR